MTATVSSRPIQALDLNLARQSAWSCGFRKAICQSEVQRDGQQDGEIVGAERQRDGRPAPRPQRQHGEQREPAPRRRGEAPGRRAHADDGIVALVLHGVDRVVDQRPGDAAGIEREGGPRQRAGHRGIAHQRAPVEGQPQHDLRPRGEALHRRIDGDQDQRQQRHAAGELVELEQDGDADQRLQHHPDQARCAASPRPTAAAGRACARPGHRPCGRRCRSRCSPRRAWRARPARTAPSSRPGGPIPAPRPAPATTSRAASAARCRSAGPSAPAGRRAAPTAAGSAATNAAGRCR